MAKKKEEKTKEKQKEVKKEIKKQEPLEEELPVLLLMLESEVDDGLIVGALNQRGLYLPFIDGLTDVNKQVKLTKTEFDKIIEEFKKGEI